MVTSLSNRWSRIGLRLKLQILIQGFLVVVLLSAQQAITYVVERQVLRGAEERAQIVADGMINGLNTLMITKVGANEVISDQTARALFIEKMGKSEQVREMRVFRAKQLDDEFPEGLPQEQPVDDMDRRVLETGKAESTIINNGKGDTWLRSVVPYIAYKEFRSIECLRCHGVDEGFVLGGASVTIDIKEDLALISTINGWIWVGQVVLQLAMVFVIGIIIHRLINQLGGEPAYVIDIVKQIARGDLSQNVQTRPQDEQSLLAATKQMQGSLRQIIGGILRSADEMNAAARQLSVSSGKVLAATERQSDSSSAVAASVEQMTICIQQISENASDAQQNTTETGSLAQEGAGSVEQVVEEMGEISSSVSNSSAVITTLGEQSHRISNIVNVIKEIADQTNLLALNAAIEAARAGEQGRGFAVVADEVRKLAERTSRSTQEIAGMIQAIQGISDDAVKGMARGIDCVGKGVELVGQAGQSMALIQQGVEKVLASVGDISAALKEQSATSSQISRNVQNIAEANEETGAIVRETSASAQRLEQMAERLKDSVSQFKL
ncbi:MAG: methyl-accepting chemotaxis protein [Rhodocyclales bacterium GT-UBC]|nr:MAG: methyl-accepting chemotaxis protein [Rhodocyclales bacterium GT-UBC]